MKLIPKFLSRFTTKASGTLSGIDNRGGWFNFLREPFAGAWQQNKELSNADLLSSPIVYACITLISNDVGKLRARLVEKDEDGIWSEVTRQSPYSPVLRRQNRYQNHIQFKQWWVMSKLRFGNALALKQRDARGIVTALYLLDWTRVTPLVADDGSIYYQLSQDNLSGITAASVTVPASEVIHDRMNCLYHPLVGISPLYAAAIAAGIGLKIQNNSATFFGNNSAPSGIIVVPGNLTDENARQLKTNWDENYTGSNRGKVAVLAGGVKFESIREKATDSQLVETLRWTDERICSVFHVPGYKVGVGASPSYNNIEALDQGYYANCLQSLIEEMEACLDEGLGLEAPIGGRQMGVDLDLDGLLRMDTKTLIDTMGAGVTSAVMTTDEARRRLNLSKVEGGDTIWRQQQYYSLSALAERDKTNPLVQPDSAPATTPDTAPASAQQPAEISDEDKAMIADARAIVATQKAIEAMLRTSLPESANV